MSQHVLPSGNCYPSISRLAVVAALCSLAGSPSVYGQDPAAVELLDAVKSALSRHPLLESQKAQIEISRGAKEIQSGLFNTTFTTGLQQQLGNTAATALNGNSLEVLPATLRFAETDYGASATKLYRNGISVAPSLDWNRTINNSLYPGALNNATVGITVTAPLLKGRGSKAVAARERAAEVELRATQYDLDFLLSSLTSNVAQDYWQYVAAVKLVEVAFSAEGRGKVYVENTQALIDAEHVPRSDINNVSANLAQRMSTRIAAENTAAVARQQLAKDMGKPASEVLLGLGNPSDDFPEVPAAVNLPDSSLQQRLSQALTARADYLAAQTRKQEALVLVPAAENALLPGLNLTFTGGYQGLRAGRGPVDYFAAPFEGVRGPTLAAGISYTYPVGNQAAKGALLQTQSAVRQYEVTIQESAREISRALSVAVDSVRAAVGRVEKANQAVAFSQAALAGAKEKYRAGIGSVVEILQIEDQLNSAFTDQVQARLAYALALVQYRFAAGTLIPAGQPSPTIRKEVFYELEDSSSRRVP